MPDSVRAAPQLDILACGMMCSPRNLGWLNRTLTDPTSNCTAPADCPLTQTVRVCTTFCDDIWSACSGVTPVGSLQTVAQLYSNDRCVVL